MPRVVKCYRPVSSKQAMDLKDLKTLGLFVTPKQS